MKEERYFYVPEASSVCELPPEEAAHAVRVLRMKPGDAAVLMDGCGTFYRVEITEASPKRCAYRITGAEPQQRAWRGRITVAVAPTKNMDRMEWLAEKATEVGVDCIQPLLCACSERKEIKAARMEKIVVSAMKQSRKAWKPQVGGMLPVGAFVAGRRGGGKYIAHCNPGPKADLFGELNKDPGGDVTILIGPEGDFTEDEVAAAVAGGYVPVSLGSSRLRTETAALEAVVLAWLSRRV